MTQLLNLIHIDPNNIFVYTRVPVKGLPWISIYACIKYCKKCFVHTEKSCCSLPTVHVQ